MLLTRRLERARLKPSASSPTITASPSGASATSRRAPDGEPGFLDELFAEDMLGDDLEDWLAESALMKRTFRSCAMIAGLIERRFPGQEKTRRQVTISTDLVYDVLRKHEPGPRAPARRAGGCGNGTPRREASRRDADADPGANHP